MPNRHRLQGNSLDNCHFLPANCWSPGRVTAWVRVHLTCSMLTFLVTLMPAPGSGQAPGVNSTDYWPETAQPQNASVSGTLRLNLSEPASVSMSNVNGNPNARAPSTEEDLPREYPTALVTASSVAAVSILVFFFLAYCWHTRQLDSRARKLAIRLAADAEQGVRRRNLSNAAQATASGSGIVRPASASQSSPVRNHYEALAMEEDLGQYSDCGRSSRGVSESDAGDSEDVFGHPHLPGIVEFGGGRSKGVRGGHRKWNRSRKYSSGPNMEKRDSAITDKELLTHLASRRHSTFFI